MRRMRMVPPGNASAAANGTQIANLQMKTLQIKQIGGAAAGGSTVAEVIL